MSHHPVYLTLQALDWIVSNNSQPERTFYIGFGHDEEIGGEQVWSCFEWQKI